MHVMIWQQCNARDIFNVSRSKRPQRHRQTNEEDEDEVGTCSTYKDLRTQLDRE
jgi:hypothetical protein